MRLIPTFAANGEKLKDRSLANIEHLLALSHVVVRRNKWGKILCAQFRPVGGANPLRRSAHQGTKYSFFRQILDVRLWQHKRLPQSQEVERLMGERCESEADRDLYLQSIFRAVPLSCMTGAPDRKLPGRVTPKIVSIETGRRPKAPQKRAA